MYRYLFSHSKILGSGNYFTSFLNNNNVCRHNDLAWNIRKFVHNKLGTVNFSLNLNEVSFNIEIYWFFLFTEICKRGLKSNDFVGVFDRQGNILDQIYKLCKDQIYKLCKNQIYKLCKANYSDFFFMMIWNFLNFHYTNMIASRSKNQFYEFLVVECCIF